MFGEYGFRGDEPPDLYALLGLSHDATAEDISRAFRAASRKHHPDVGGDPEAFKRINAARQILIDPARRRVYDQFLAEWQQAKHQAAASAQATPTGVADPLSVLLESLRVWWAAQMRQADERLNEAKLERMRQERLAKDPDYPHTIWVEGAGVRSVSDFGLTTGKGLLITVPIPVGLAVILRTWAWLIWWIPFVTLLIVGTIAPDWIAPSTDPHHYGEHKNGFLWIMLGIYPALLVARSLLVGVRTQPYNKADLKPWMTQHDRRRPEHVAKIFFIGAASVFVTVICLYLITQ